MPLVHAHLLDVQRRIYDVPRGPGRFRHYLDVMKGSSANDIELPLPAMNPMAKAHVPALLDAWMAAGAEHVAAEEVRRVALEIQPLAFDTRVGLVMADDLMGGWTDRALTEASHRLEPIATIRRGWTVVLLWSSEEVDLPWLRREVRRSIHRTAHVLRNGPARTLGTMMQQEGRAARFAGDPLPEVDAGSRRRLADLRGETRYPVCFAALFGDDAARHAGYDPLGVPKDAGLRMGRLEAEDEDPLAVIGGGANR